ncbi:hypothetical protein D3C87_1100120 [compost metagenome]
MDYYKVTAPNGITYQPDGPGSERHVSAGELLALDSSLRHLIGTQIGKNQVQRIDPAALESAVEKVTSKPLDSDGGTGEGPNGPIPANGTGAETQGQETGSLIAYLEARTRDELREIAKAGGIDIPGNSSKAAFIEAILAKSAAEAAGQQ